MHRVHLLEAEFDVLKGNFRGAFEKYDLAKTAAQRNGYLFERALTCERIGCALQTQNCPEEALAALNEAVQVYSEWGARTKVTQLREKMIPAIRVSVDSKESRQAIAKNEFTSHIHTRSSPTCTP